MADDRLYFRQLLAGLDFAEDDAVAAQMANFSYVIGDRASGQALLVDPAYGVEDLVGLAEADGMAVAGVLVTHHHPDHVGGDLRGWQIEGLSALLERRPVPVHVNRHEVGLVSAWTGVSEGEMVAHDSGDTVTVGSVEVTLVHTPGHTPGSQCFMVEGMLVSGDTLFLSGCGRTDLPGSDPSAMYDSLRRLASLPAATTVFPGHNYSSAPSAAMGDLVAGNLALRPMERDQWLAMFAPTPSP